MNNKGDIHTGKIFGDTGIGGCVGDMDTGIISDMPSRCAGDSPNGGFTGVAEKEKL